MNTFTPLLKKLVNPNVSGFSYAVMQNGKTVCKDAFGKSFPSCDDLYNVGSVSKMYNAVAVLKACELGLMQLDAPVCSYLPKFKMADPRYTQITVRHLLCHTSGLPGTQLKKSFNTCSIDDYYQEVYLYMEKAKLKADPGEFAVYCNDGFTLAEMAVSAVSGMSYGQFLKKYITDPINAFSTGCSNDNMPSARIMSLGNDSPEYLALAGAGGIQSNMEDVCRFGNIFLNMGTPILTFESIAQINKSHGATFVPTDNHTCQYGLGWDYIDLKMRNYKLEGVFEKGGTTAHFSTAFVVMPQYGISACASATLDHKSNVLEVLMRLISEYLFVNQKCNISSQRQAVPETMKSFSGIYHNSSLVLEVEIGKREANIYINNDGVKKPYFTDMPYKDGFFHAVGGEKITFTAYNQDAYLMLNKLPTDYLTPFAQKFGNIPPIPKIWEKAIGKTYIITDGQACDLFVGQIINGCKITQTADGMLSALILGEGEGGVKQNVTFCPCEDGQSIDIMKIPAHGGRDLMTPELMIKNGIDYLFINSFLMRDVTSLPLYSPDNKAIPTQENPIYKVKNMQYLPDFTGYNRIVIMDCELTTIFDSKKIQAFEGIKEGYIVFFMH